MTIADFRHLHRLSRLRPIQQLGRQLPVDAPR